MKTLKGFAKTFAAIMLSAAITLSGSAFASAADESGNAHFTFTDTKEIQPDLYVTKTATSAVEGYSVPDDAEFTFVLKWDDNGDGYLDFADEAKYYLYDEGGAQIVNEDSKDGLFATNMYGRFTLKTGQYARFETVGEIQYEVTELETENFVQKTPAGGESATGTVDADGTTVNFENLYVPFDETETTMLAVSKSLSWPGGYEMPDLSDMMFTFKVTIDDEEYGGQDYTIYDPGTKEEVDTGTTDRDGTFKMNGGYVALFKDIPSGVDYAVEEVEMPDEWRAVGSTSDAGATAAPLTYASFTDAETSFVAQKRRSDNVTGEDGGEFSFTLTDADGNAMHAGYYLYADDGSLIEPGRLFYTDTEGRFTLQAGQTAVFVGIEEGTEYKVVEGTDDDAGGGGGDDDDGAYNVKYAVTLYGISQDELADGGKAGLTFGPAAGKSYISTYDAHLTKDEYDSGRYGVCLHWMSWDEIIAQSRKDPAVFEDCLKAGCTHAVNLDLNDTLLDTSYAEKMDSGDGTGVLYKSIKESYRNWNSKTVTTGGWSASQARAVLNGRDGQTGENAAYALTADDCLLSCFPESLRDAIAAKAVRSDTVWDDQSQENNKTTNDRLWLFSGKELYGAGADGIPVIRNLEGELCRRSQLLEIITSETEGGTWNQEIPALENYREDGVRESWWLRTLYSGMDGRFVCGVDYDGNWDYDYPCNTVEFEAALAPGFCLAGPDGTGGTSGGGAGEPGYTVDPASGYAATADYAAAIPTYVFTNTQLTDITIKKIRKNNSLLALPGAEFTIFKLKDGGNKDNPDDYEECNGSASTLTTGSDGTCTFTSLPEGTYRIVETKAPDGYSSCDDAIVVTLPFTMTKAEIREQGIDTGSEDFHGIWSDRDDVYYFYDLAYDVSNEMVVFALPNTGGMPRGLIILLIAGGGAASAGAYLRNRYRKKQGGGNSADSGGEAETA